MELTRPSLLKLIPLYTRIYLHNIFLEIQEVVFKIVEKKVKIKFFVPVHNHVSGSDDRRDLISKVLI